MVRKCFTKDQEKKFLGKLLKEGEGDKTRGLNPEMTEGRQEMLKRLDRTKFN